MIFVVAGTAGQSQEPILKTGDRVVFLGDSIQPGEPDQCNAMLGQVAAGVKTLSAANTRRMVCPVFLGRNLGQHRPLTKTFVLNCNQKVLP